MADAIMSIFSQIMVYLNGEDLQNTLGQNLSSYMYDAYDLVKDLQLSLIHI